MKFRKPLALLLTLILLLALAAPAPAADEPWYAEAVAFVIERGLMESGEGGFDPGGAATGEVLLGALYSMEGSPSARTGDPAALWKETLPGISAGALVRSEAGEFLSTYAASRGFDPAGLLIGDPAGDLMLDKVLTRAELAQILLRLSGKDIHAFEEITDLQILSTSDLHGKLYPWIYATDSEDASGSMTQLASAVKALRGETSLLVDAGDTIQDNYAHLFLDDDVHPMIAALNAIGYDVWVTGNHEYNFGLENLRKDIAACEARTLVGNVLDAEGEPLAPGYTVIEKNGLRIGIIGMVTPNIVHWDAMNLTGCTVSNPVEETRKIIDRIRDDTDVLIGVMHMGLPDDIGMEDSGVIALADACPEFAMIVAAHSHELIEAGELNGVLVVENKHQAQTISEAHLYLGKSAEGWILLRRSAKAHLIAPYEPDAALAELLRPYHERALADAHVVIGRLEGGDLVPENEIAQIPAAQIMDTAMIDLVNEVQMYYSGARVSATALFTMNANLREGEIRRSDVSQIYKYDNTLYLLQMTGAQLKAYMEWSAGYYNQYRDGDLTISFDESIRAYLYDMFSGVSYEIDISKPVGERIVNLTWPDGTPVMDDDSFTIAVNNYRANTQLLGDAIYGDGEKPVLLEIDVRGDIGGVRELIAEYIRSVKGGVITPVCDHNWRIIGCDWDEALHKKAVELLSAGILTVPASADGRTPNVRSITVDDLDLP